MKRLSLTIPWMYFTGIQSGDISVLFFDKVRIPDAKKGDLISLYHNESVKKYFISGKPIAFKEVTNDIAKSAGFASRELLANHLMERYNIPQYNIFTSKSQIDDEIFYMIEIADDPVNTYYDGEVDVKMDIIPGTMVSANINNTEDFWDNYNALNTFSIPDSVKFNSWSYGKDERI